MDKDRIFAGKKDRKLLKERFQVTDATVSEALRFISSSRKNRELRSYAVNYLQCPIFILNLKVI